MMPEPVIAQGSDPTSEGWESVSNGLYAKGFQDGLWRLPREGGLRWTSETVQKHRSGRLRDCETRRRYRKALTTEEAPTDTERPKCPCGAWYWDEHTMACAIRVSAVATAPAVEKAKYRIRLLEDDNLLLRSRIAEACLHCSPGSVVWEILNPREESRPDRNKDG
jgi:hypothetical protein